MLTNIDQADKKINLGLENIKQALELLGNPQDSFSVIHIAGTNGKGSVCLFLELMYLFYRSDLRIAKYTSPHLVSVTERIRVAGKEISEEDFLRLYDVILRAKPEGSGSQLQASALDPSSLAPRDDLALTEFEKLTCVAFIYFKEQQVDLVILETGLGGRLDATNVCENKLATAITNIAFDHMDYLGTSLDKIREEKEGIKRAGVKHYEGESFKTNDEPNSYYGQNFQLALKIFEDLNGVKLDEAAKYRILLAFESQSRARFQLDMQAGYLVDGAHNAAAAKELAKFIKRKLAKKPKTFIIAILDKDFEGFMTELMPAINLDTDRIIFTTVNSSRSISPENLLERAQRINPALSKIAGTALNLEEASKQAQGLKVVTGSLYLAGEFLAAHTSS